MSSQLMVTKMSIDKSVAKTIPSDLQDLLKKLEFLGMLKQGYKMDTKNSTLFDDNSWSFDTWMKWWNRKESRKNTLDALKSIIGATIDAISKYEDTEFLKYIINSLNSARIGISKLEITYRDDSDFASELKVILQNIDIPLENYKTLIKGCD